MAYFCCFQYDLLIFVCIQIGVQDIATRVIAEGLRVEQTIISKIMTRNPIYVRSDTPAIEALQKMVQGMSSDSGISFDRVY